MSNPTELPDLERAEFEAAWRAKYDMPATVQFSTFSDGRYQATAINDFYEGWCMARHAQPEGEAPQADCVDCPKCAGSLVIGEKRGVRCLHCDGRGYLAPATLSPLCGAQHAESGKEAYQVFSHDSGEWYGVDKAQYDRAHDSCRRVLAAQQAAAPHELKSNSFVAQNHEEMAIKGQQAAAPGALAKSARALAEKWHKDAVDTGFATSEAAVELLEVLDAAPSAPGTPEAPKPVRPKRLTEEEVRDLALQHLHDDTESAGRNSFFTFSAEGLDGFAIDLMDRAAQLDGGQEGSAT